jgi:uncharacterized protein
MTAIVALPTMLRQIHRIRRHLRELHAEMERLPRLLKAHQAKIAKSELGLKEAQDGLKHLKISNHDNEVNLKATSQLLAKYERQLDDMTVPKEIDAKKKEIAGSKSLIAQLEEQILAGMAAVEEQAAKLPEMESAFKKAKSELAAFETESKERSSRLSKEVKLAEEELKKYEARLPATVKGAFERLVKAHGPEALAAVEKNSCGHCHTSVTIQMVNELSQGRFLFCNSCGRLLYPME